MSDSDEMPPLEDDVNYPEGRTFPVGTTTAASTAHQSNFSNIVDVSYENDDSDCDDEDAWEEIEENITGNTKCLFCDKVLQAVRVCLAHMLDIHGFDFVAFVCKFKLDQISYIKLVNYVRQEQPPPDKLFAENTVKWNCESFLKPVLNEDALLMFGE